MNSLAKAIFAGVFSMNFMYFNVVDSLLCKRASLMIAIALMGPAIGISNFASSVAKVQRD